MAPFSGRLGKTKADLAEPENILIKCRLRFVWFGSSSSFTSYFPIQKEHASTSPQHNYLGNSFFCVFCGDEKVAILKYFHNFLFLRSTHGEKYPLYQVASEIQNIIAWGGWAWVEGNARLEHVIFTQKLLHFCNCPYVSFKSHAACLGECGFMWKSKKRWNFISGLMCHVEHSTHKKVIQTTIQVSTGSGTLISSLIYSIEAEKSQLMSGSHIENPLSSHHQPQPPAARPETVRLLCLPPEGALTVPWKRQAQKPCDFSSHLVFMPNSFC